ncbi:MAG: SpoIIE family protein phosphatase [Ilumatobacteraceae bacterium]
MSQDDLLWHDPEHVVDGLLHVVSANLGGDLVVWVSVDDATGLLTVIDLAAPLASSQELADLVQVSGALTPTSLSAAAVGLDEPLVMPRLDRDFDPRSLPAGSLPQPWVDYLIGHPVNGLMVVPVELDAATTGLLLAARSTVEAQYTDDDLEYLVSGAQRLAGRPVEASDAVNAQALRSRSSRVFGWLRRTRFRELLIGVAPPAIVAAMIGPIDDSARFWPGAVLVVGCVVAALIGGVRAATLAAAVSTVLLWWAFTPPNRSWMFAGWGDFADVGMFVAAATAVVVLQRRLESVRRLQVLERQLSETLLDQSPIAMAVFDRQLRYQRVNGPMAQMNGVAAARHIGLRPGDLSPVAGQLYEHLLIRVRDTGLPITDHELTILMPEIGLERHWSVNYQPLRGGGSEVVGIGAAVTDVTVAIVARRQAERLLQLSEALTTSLDEQQIADCICSFLIDTFQGRATVALRDGDGLFVAALAGIGQDEVARRVGTRVAMRDDGPIAEAFRDNTQVLLSSPAEFHNRYPRLMAAPASTQEQASLSMPLRADPSGVAVGVMHVGWSAPRPITEMMTTLAGTASSLVTLALARIEATQAAHEVEFRQALDAMLDDVAVGRAIRGDDGQIVDFVIEFVNSHSSTGARRGTDGLVGQLLCEIHPDWRTSGMFDRFCDVVETGLPYQGHRVQYADVASLDEHKSPADGTVGNRRQAYWTLQVAKFGDGYISASRDVTEMVLAEEASRATALQAAAERQAIGLLQAAALPSTLPDLPGVRIAAVYEPADARQPVGGDWYDIFALDDNLVALVIADVAGHGHSAAVFMLQVRNVFRAIAAEHTAPAEVLTRANNVTARLNETDGPFVTCCFAVLDIAARTLSWAQAGHFSPMIVHADGASRYLDERPGAPLAFFEGQRYESSSIELNPGDRILMFTDGLVERRREHLDIGLARLAALASWHADLPVQKFVETLAASVTERFDDLAVVCVDIVG